MAMPSVESQSTVARFRRTGLMALIIVVVAAGFWGWSRWTEPRRVDAIRQHVRGLLDDSNARRASGTEALIGLEDALESIDRAHVVDIVVIHGDHDVYGDGQATHLALITTTDGAQLGLRVVNKSLAPDSITVIGHFRP